MTAPRGFEANFLLCDLSIKVNNVDLYLCRYALAFLTPGLPFIPTIAITVNVYLIFKLSILTLVRFTLWMTLGLIMYFYYGITHSSLENPQEEFELAVDKTYVTPPQLGEQTAVWDRHGYENKMADDTWSQGNTYWPEQNSAWNTNSNNAPSNRQQSSKRPSPAPSRNQQQSRVPVSPHPPAQSSNEAKKDGFGLFIDETQFPSWDD